MVGKYAGCMVDFVKQRTDAPQGFFAAEAAGLRWLAEADAVPVVGVIEQGDDFLRLPRLDETAPSAEAARQFGRRLADLHDSGAPAFGWAPSTPAWFGPLDSPFEVAAAPCPTFSQFWAEQRLDPLLSEMAGMLSAEDEELIASAIEVIRAGAFDGICGDGGEEPSRVHGDLWSGNLLWTPSGAVLIDPAAHGGHRLEDLALLTLFGTPFLDEIFSGYESAHPLPDGWRGDLPAHSFFALLAHVKLFGRGFLGQTLSAARTIRDRSHASGR